MRMSLQNKRVIPARCESCFELCFLIKTLPESVNLNGNQIPDQPVIVEEFIEFFSNVGKNLKKL